MSEAIEAGSLSALTDLAANPPLDPRNPTDPERPPLVLYIARVPGSKDVFLSPLKPKQKVVSAQDVESSLYFVHINQPEDELLLRQELHATQQNYTETSATENHFRSLPRRPLSADSRNSLERTFPPLPSRPLPSVTGQSSPVTDQIPPVTDQIPPITGPLPPSQSSFPPSNGRIGRKPVNPSVAPLANPDYGNANPRFDAGGMQQKPLTGRPLPALPIDGLETTFGSHEVAQSKQPSQLSEPSRTASYLNPQTERAAQANAVYPRESSYASSAPRLPSAIREERAPVLPPRTASYLSPQAERAAQANVAYREESYHTLSIPRLSSDGRGERAPALPPRTASYLSQQAERAAQVKPGVQAQSMSFRTGSNFDHQAEGVVQSSITLIRRDPTSGAQWNVAKIFDPPVVEVSSESIRSGGSSERYKQMGAPIFLEILTPGYSKFIDRPESSGNSARNSGSNGATFSRRMYLEGSRNATHSYTHRKSVSHDSPLSISSQGRGTLSGTNSGFSHNEDFSDTVNGINRGLGHSGDFSGTVKGTHGGLSHSEDFSGTVKGTYSGRGHNRDFSGTVNGTNSGLSHNEDFFGTVKGTNRGSGHSEDFSGTVQGTNSGFSHNEDFSNAPALIRPPLPSRPTDRGYAFLSPWNTPCYFSTGGAGRSVICKHTISSSGPSVPLDARTSARPTAEETRKTTGQRKRSWI
ncbi:MAG: hypothetical protein M1821_002455 [Bathelium mastoideum]|nr:MAG: hypothetical protein M1821_002455 [Bathelium mastoideum]